MMSLRDAVPRQALKTPFRKSTLQQVALQVLEISRMGLKNRRRRTAHTDDEALFLDPLFEIARSGQTPAEELLANYHGRWGGSVDPVYTEYAY